MEKLTSLMCLAAICASGTAMDAPGFVYHNYTQLTLYLSDVAQSYPNITCLYSIGKSVEGTFLLQLLQCFMNGELVWVTYIEDRYNFGRGKSIFTE